LAWQGWIDGFIWVSVVVIGLVFHRKLYTLVTQAAVLLFIIQTAQVVYAGFSHSDRSAPPTKIAQLETLEQLASFSAHQNILHIVLDGFQSDFFDELIQHPQIGEDYHSKLSGFTFYRETLGIFPFTRFAVPAFLSGQLYKNEQPKNEFSSQSIAGDSLLNAAGVARMELDIASPEYWAQLYINADVTHSYVIPEGGHGTEFEFRLANTTRLLDLALFRVAPHFLKQKIYNNQRWLLTPMLMDSEYLQFLYFAHTEFLNQLVEKMAVNRTTPTYKFFHVMNTHNPMVVDGECNYAGGALQTNRNTLLNQSKCTVDTVVRLLDKMKQLGVYDNSLIILHGDHGGWVRHRDYQPEQVNQQQEIPFWAVSLGSPLLAIKPPGAKGALVTSDRLASITDIADTVADIMDWPQQFNGKSLLKLGESETRTRYFYLYYWQKDAWEADYTGPIQEFEISGKHNSSEWIPKRVFEHQE